MLIAMLVTTGCAEFVPPAPHDHHFHEPETTFNPKDHYTTVADVIRGRGCSTGPLKSLDTQIAAELSCLAQTPLGRIDQETTLRLGEGVRPHLQRDAADAIKRAGQRLGTLMLTSGWRSVAQQHVLKSWEGRAASVSQRRLDAVSINRRSQSTPGTFEIGMFVGCSVKKASRGTAM